VGQGKVGGGSLRRRLSLPFALPSSVLANAGDGNPIYVNNRLEGCAPLTIEGILSKTSNLRSPTIGNPISIGYEPVGQSGYVMGPVGGLGARNLVAPLRVSGCL